MPLSAKDYEAIADILSEHPNPEVTEALSEYFAQDNPRFDRARFIKAGSSDDLHFTITLRLGNAALPLDEETGGWTDETLIGVKYVLEGLVERLRMDDVSESVLDANGNAVGTALFHH